MFKDCSKDFSFMGHTIVVQWRIQENLLRWFGRVLYPIQTNPILQYMFHQGDYHSHNQTWQKTERETAMNTETTSLSNTFASCEVPNRCTYSWITTDPKIRIPSRKLTYPALGKGKSSSKVPGWGYVNFLEDNNNMRAISVLKCLKHLLQQFLQSSRFGFQWKQLRLRQLLATQSLQDFRFRQLLGKDGHESSLILLMLTYSWGDNIHFLSASWWFMIIALLILYSYSAIPSYLYQSVIKKQL